MQTEPNCPRVVIIGAGFGGMQAAQSLANSGAEIVLIDRNNYNTFVPLLYQVTTAQIEPEKIAYPIRTILRSQTRTHFLHAEVRQVDFARQIVATDGPTVAYDYLVLATGSRTPFLGVAGAAEHAFPLRTLEQAVALRNHLFCCFEQATRARDRQQRQQLLTVAIVGGGPTGVEVAGALVELKQALQRDYPEIDLQELQIVLVQAGDRLLSGLPERLGRYATRKLRQHGANIHFQTRVSRVMATAIELEDGNCLPTETVIWAAGLEAAPPGMSDVPEVTSQQKLKVRATLQLLSYHNVYAIGDVAYAEQQGKPLAGVAPEALQQGVAAARNISRQLRGKAPAPFRYRDKGRLAIIGRYTGTGKVGPLLLVGFLPWLLWLGVHLVYLPGFRNRLLVLLSWLHAYGFGDRAVRLVLSSKSIEARQPSARS